MADKYLLRLKGGRYGRKRQRRKNQRKFCGRGIGSTLRKGLKVALKKVPKYAKKFLNLSAGRVAKDFVRNKIGEKNYRRLEKGVNITDKVLSNSRVNNLLERI